VPIGSARCTRQPSRHGQAPGERRQGRLGLRRKGRPRDPGPIGPFGAGGPLWWLAVRTGFMMRRRGCGPAAAVERLGCRTSATAPSMPIEQKSQPIGLLGRWETTTAPMGEGRARASGLPGLVSYEQATLAAVKPCTFGRWHGQQHIHNGRQGCPPRWSVSPSAAPPVALLEACCGRAAAGGAQLVLVAVEVDGAALLGGGAAPTQRTGGTLARGAGPAGAADRRGGARRLTCRCGGRGWRPPGPTRPPAPAAPSPWW
jgi:hypothetical protein